MKDTCTPMFTAALFTIAKILEHPKQPSTDHQPSMGQEDVAYTHTHTHTHKDTHTHRHTHTKTHTHRHTHTHTHTQHDLQTRPGHRGKVPSRAA